MVSSLDVGNFFIDMGLRTGITDITNLKLNKLVYYAQGCSLAKLGHPLFKEDVQAWIYGPVIPTIYHTFKRYGRNSIDKVSGEYTPSIFTPEEIEVLGAVYLRYGNYNPNDLMWITHETGAPWQTSYHEGELNIVIPQKKMQEYFKLHIDEFKTSTANIDKIKRVGYRDSEGALVLPTELDCPEDDIFDQICCANGA